MLLFVDQLTNVDFSFLDPQRGLLGETYLANLTLEGDLDDQGMVCDFGVVKKRVRHWLDHELDHRLAVPIQSPNIRIQELGDALQIDWLVTNTNGEKKFAISTTGPRDAFALVDADILTPNTVAHWCKTQLRALFSDINISLEINFTTESIASAYYHYSHGLKKHLGNCQRIAHGHRSRIHIWKNGVAAPELESEWAKLWEDIYLGTREDIVSEFEQEGETYLRFAYHSQQGYFDITLPQSIIYLIDTDSTVEFIAHHIAQMLKLKFPQDKIRVKAFEGLGKGAIVEF